MGKGASKTKYADLFDAASHGDVQGVKYFVQKKSVPIDKLNSRHQSAAHVAVENGHLNVLKYLVNENPFIFPIEDDQQNTIFHVALKKGFLDAVDFLLHEFKSDAFEKTADGRTPLQLAAENGHLRVVRYLIDKHKTNPLEFSSTTYGDTAVHSAAKNGHLEVLAYFIEDKKIDVNVLNGKGQPPVFSATMGNHLNVVRYLVEEYSANVTLVDHDNNTILHYAFYNENLAVPRYLLDEKRININVNMPNNAGETLVLMAIERHDRELLEYIVGEKKAEVNAPDRHGEYPLHKAVKTGILELVQYLVSHGARPYVKNFYGKTPLDMAKLHNKYLQQGLAAQLVEYLQLITPRRRRSVSTLYGVHVFTPSERTPKKLLAGLIGNNVIAQPQFDNFLLFVVGYIRLATKLRHWVSENEYLMSPKELIARKFDSFATDAVEAAFAFERTQP